MHTWKKILAFLQKRASSTFLLSYSFFWVAYHWEGIVALFFTDQNLIMKQYNMLKNEYLAASFFGLSVEGTADFWEIASRVGGFIIPAFLAYLYVWWLPELIINPSYKKEINYKIDRRLIKNEAEKRLIDSNREKDEASLKETEVKIDLARKKEEIKDLSREEQWELDFDSHSDTDFLVNTLEALKMAIYEHEGYYRPTMNTDEVLFCDVNNLVSVNSTSDTLSLTEKGRFYLKQLSKNLQKSNLK